MKRRYPISEIKYIYVSYLYGIVAQKLYRGEMFVKHHTFLLFRFVCVLTSSHIGLRLAIEPQVYVAKFHPNMCINIMEKVDKEISLESLVQVIVQHCVYKCIKMALCEFADQIFLRFADS